MSNLIKVVNGEIVYNGFLTSNEKASVDLMIETLKEEVPQIEAELKEKFGSGVWNKYNLGKILGELLEKYDVSYNERRMFWDGIKYLASKEVHARDEGKKSKRRSFYEQCYVLSKNDNETVEKLTWRQWSSLLDRTVLDNDNRIYQWIKEYPGKFKNDEWREFLKALHMYLLKKDTTVFTDDEIYDIYSSLYLMAEEWSNQFKVFKKEHPNSNKIKNKEKWSKKYYSECLLRKRASNNLTVTKELCEDVFNDLIMY